MPRASTMRRSKPNARRTPNGATSATGAMMPLPPLTDSSVEADDVVLEEAPKRFAPPLTAEQIAELPEDVVEAYELAATIEIPLYHGPPMESNDALLNLILLYVTLRDYMKNIRPAFIGVEMAVFYDIEQVMSRNFVAPDFFVVLDAPDGIRTSFVTFREQGRSPQVVIEMRSRGTAMRDRTVKRQIYQDVLKVGDFFRFDPPSGRLEGERLVEGRYQSIEVEEGRRQYCAQLDLYLVLWTGAFQGIERRWLRWQKPDGALLPTPEERAEALRLEAEAQRLEAEAQRLEAEAQRQEAEALRQAAETALAEVERLRRLLDERTAPE